MFKRVHEHKGTSFLEIFQNCLVYNDGAFAHFTERNVAKTAQLHAEHGKPLLFGENKEKGLRLKPGTLEVEVVTVGENGITEADILVHDETNRTLAHILASLEPPEFPVVLGVLFCKPGASYEEDLDAQMQPVTSGGTRLERLNALMRQGQTWTKGEGPA